jgi:hypothetical protein
MAVEPRARTSAPNPFTVNGAREPRPRPDPWSLLSAEEQARLKEAAEQWRTGLQNSVERAGFRSVAEYLAATVRRSRAGRSRD